MSPLTSPRGRGRPGATSKLSVLLAGSGAAYVAAMALASRSTSASLWGIHLAAFLRPPERAAVLGAAALGAGLLIATAVRGSKRPAPSGAVSRGTSPPRHASPRHPGAWTTVLPLCALPLLAAAFWAFRARTHFLGDGIVWLANLTSEQFPKFSEPLSTEAWHGYVRVLHALGLRADAGSLATLPVICGVIAAVLVWFLARELAPGTKGRFMGTVLLLTLGVSQLYFGYIESYPIISVLILGYLLAGVRSWRSERVGPWPGVALALVAAAHVVSLLLAPSYVWLVARSRTTRVRRLLLLLFPAVLAAALFAWLRFGLDDLLRPFGTMREAMQSGTGGFSFEVRGIVSPRRWLDLANLALLLAPAPLILLLSRAASGGWPLRPRPDSPAGRHEAAPSALLMSAALPGLLAAGFLVVPSSPAQDWDLLAIVVLPAAVLAVAAGLPALQRAPRMAATGLALIAGAALGSFVLVNADESAGIRRFEALLTDKADLRPHERAYGNEKLATYWADRGDFERAVIHARRAVEAEPSNPRYWVKAAGSLISLGRHAEAIPYLTEGLRRDPARADANYDLGICYAKTNRYDEAVGAFQAAVLADADRPDYRHNLGVALFASGKSDSARLVWTEILRRWEGYPLTKRAMARRFGAGAWESTATAAVVPDTTP